MIGQSYPEQLVDIPVQVVGVGDDAGVGVGGARTIVPRAAYDASYRRDWFPIDSFGIRPVDLVFAVVTTAIGTGTTTIKIELSIDGVTANAEKTFTLNATGTQYARVAEDFVKSGTAEAVGKAGWYMPYARVTVTHGGTRANIDNFGVWLLGESNRVSVVNALEVYTKGPVTKVERTDPGDVLYEPVINAAKGERRCFQLVLKAPHCKVRRVKLDVSDVVGPGGVLPVSNVKFYKIWYINYYPTTSYIGLPKRDIQDPLEPYRGPFDIEAGDVQGIWVELIVPRNIAAGDYTGVIYVTPANSTPVRVNFRLHVYDFQMPVRATLKQAWVIDPFHICAKEGVTFQSPAYYDLVKKYWDECLDRGMHPWSPPYDGYGTNWSDARCKAAIVDPRVTCLCFPYVNGSAEKTKFIDHAESLLQQGRLYCGPVDEPSNKADCDTLNTRGAQLHALDPRVRIQVSYYQVTGLPGDGKITTYCNTQVDCWTPLASGDWYDEAALEARKAEGDEVWLYTTGSVNISRPNVFMQDRGMAHRAIPWLCYWKNDANGWLYWNILHWADVNDVWVDGSTGKVLHEQCFGEGSLLYPGAPRGIYGPCFSLRFDMIRDGIQDHAYLKLLESLTSRSYVMNYVNQIITGWYTFATDDNLVETVRDQIAREIEARGGSY